MAEEKPNLSEAEALEVSTSPAAESVTPDLDATGTGPSGEGGTEGAAEEEELTAEDIWSPYPCEDDDETAEECIEVCPDCIPDPEYPATMVPNWRNRTLPYIDKRDCTYNVTVWTDYTQEGLKDAVDALYADANAAQTRETRDEVYNNFIQKEIYENPDYLIQGIAKLLKVYKKSLQWSDYQDYCEEIEEYLEERQGGGPTRADDAEDDAQYSRESGVVEQAAEVTSAAAQVYSAAIGGGFGVSQATSALGVIGEFDPSTTTGPDGEELEEPAYQADMQENWTGARYFWDHVEGWMPEREFWYVEGQREFGAYDYEDEFLVRGGADDWVQGSTHWPVLWADSTQRESGGMMIFQMEPGRSVYNPVADIFALFDEGITYSIGTATGEGGAFRRTTYSFRLDPNYNLYIHDSESKAYTKVDIGVLSRIFGPQDPATWNSAREAMAMSTLNLNALRNDGVYNAGPGTNVDGQIMFSPDWMDTDEYRLGQAYKAVTKLAQLADAHRQDLAGIINPSYGSEWNYQVRGTELAGSTEIKTPGDFIFRLLLAPAEEEIQTLQAIVRAVAIEDTLEDKLSSLGQSFDPGPGETVTGAIDPETNEPAILKMSYSENRDFFSTNEWLNLVKQSVTGPYLIENKFATITQHYITPVAGTRMKVLLSIPGDIFWQIPEAEIETEDATYTVQEEENVIVTLPYEVEFKTEDIIDGLFSNSAWLLNHYANKRIPMGFEADGSVVIEMYENTGIEDVESALARPSDSVDLESNLEPNRMSAMFEWNAYLSDKWGDAGPPSYSSVYSPADVKQQADNIRDFKNNLLDFLGENIDGWQMSWLMEHNKKSGIENVKIEFTPQYHIKTVTYNKKGCPPVTLTGRKRAAKMIADAKADPEHQANPWINPEIVAAEGWDGFAYQYPQTDPRTMAYIASIPFINDVAMASTPMEWQDFITLWTYPQVSVGNFNDLEDADAESCMNIGGALSNILMEGVDVFFEVLLSTFDKHLCRAITDQVVDDFAPNLRDMSRMAVREILENDPFISDVISAILFVRNIDNLWHGIINELGLCGMLGLLQTLFDCLWSGVDWGDILEKVIRSALKEMDIQFFKRLLIGLPRHVQDQIAEHTGENLAEGLADYRPWDAEPGLQRNKQAIYNTQMEYEKSKILDERQELVDVAQAAHASSGAPAEDKPMYKGTSGTAYTSVHAAEKESDLGPQEASDISQQHAAVTDALDQMTEAQAGRVAGVDFEYSYEGKGIQERKQSQTLGSIIGGAIPMEEIKDAYIDALMHLLAPEELMDLLEEIPGFTFLKMLADLLKCPGVQIFHPPLKSWFNDLAKMFSEWDLFCEGIQWIGWPDIKGIGNIWNIMKALAKLILEALEAAIVQALVTMLKMLLEWIFGILCALMGVLGAAALAAVGLIDQTEFMDIMKSKLCDNGAASDEEIADALGTILSALGATDASTPEEVSAVGEEFTTALMDYIEAAPALNTLELLNGTPSDRTLLDTADFFDNREDSFSDTLSNPRTVKKLFNTLGQTFLGSDVVNALRDSIIEKVQCAKDGEFTIPYCPTGEGAGAARDAVQSVFCRFDLPETECENMADQTLSDLDNLTNDMLDFYNSNGSSLINPRGTDQADPCNVSDDGTYWPTTDEISEAAMAHQATGIVGLIQSEYEKELVDDGGIFDRILSDCDGRGKQKHDRKLVDLLENGIADNPTTVGKYLQDILKGDRTNITVYSGQKRGISAGDSITKAGGSFEMLHFDMSGVGYGPIAGAFNNSLPIFESDRGGGITQNIYGWSYGRVWQDKYKNRDDLTNSQRNDYSCEEGQWDVWDVRNAYVKVDTRPGREPKYKYDKDKERWRNFKLGADEYEVYPEPHARMIFLGTDPSLGNNSEQEAGMPAYYFHYWHYEKYEREEAGPGWLSAEDELTKDAAKMHIFSLMPQQDTKGYPDSMTQGDDRGEFTNKFANMSLANCGADDVKKNGNIETFFRGLGALSNNGRSKGALNPFIKVSRNIDGDALSFINDLQLEIPSGKPQQAAVWGYVMAQSILDAAGPSATVTDTAPEGSGIEDDSYYVSHLGSPAIQEFINKMMDTEYSEITQEFLEQYSKIIADNKDLWKSGLLNFDLVEMSEDECIDVGLSKNKGDDEDKKEIPLPRPRGKKKLRHGSYSPTNSEKTGWYRPEVRKGTGGLSENVDLPEDEYGLAAYYIHQQYQRGWARVADEYLPGPANPCDEQVSADLFDWEGISDHISTAVTKIPTDERVSANPACIWDPPYNRVNTKESKAKIEGIIKATMRVAVFENFIKGMPSFTKFNPSTGCYGDLVPAYMFATMRQELFHRSRRSYIFFGGPGKLMNGHNRYDYKFLEQCCNMYARLVADGEIEPTSEALEAIDEIDKVINKVYYEPHIDIFRAKRKALRRAVWEKTEKYSTVIAKELFRHELETSSKKFADWSKPQVDNLQLYFLNGNMDLDGAKTSCAVVDAGTDLSDLDYLENGGFVLEKYIKIEDYEDVSRIDIRQIGSEGEVVWNAIGGITERSSELRHIVNLEDWAEHLASYQNFTYIDSSGEDGAETTSHKISDLFYKWSYGVRLCYVPSWSKGGGGPTPWDLVDADGKSKHLAFGHTGAATIPVAHTEIEIPGDLRIDNFDIVGDYDFDCLLKQFLEDVPFKTCFEYVFPLDRLLSVPTIYIMHCFLDSIGMDDGWYQEKRMDPDDDSYIGDPHEKIMSRFFRGLQHGSGPGLKTGDWLLFTANMKRRHASFRNWPGDHHLSALAGPDCFVRTRRALCNAFESEYEFRSRYSSEGGLPKFRIRINLPPWSLGLPRFFKNRQLEGPECEDAVGSSAESAAYNRL